jgi:dimethylglycine catabolism B
MSAHHLPLLDRRRDELSKCAFCPKLCRATCVVSEVEPREALTPWGKMTNAFDAARRGGVDGEQAELAWACSNCMKCREACDHRNPVTESLNDARAEFVALGQAPAPVQSLLERAPLVEAAHGRAAEALRSTAGVSSGARSALLLGCRYAASFPEEARAAIRLASALVGEVQLLGGCCGHWQTAAGAPERARKARDSLHDELAGKRLLVLDPRCALELRELGATTLVELSARHPERFARLAEPSPAYRYHDSCALGRGLGLYDEPRRLLGQLLGAPPLELETPRELSRCSGGGGILPVSMPAIAAGAATRLRREHEALGGGTVVTSCASSLSQLRRAGAPTVDLVTLLESGLRRED